MIRFTIKTKLIVSLVISTIVVVCMTIIFASSMQFVKLENQKNTVINTILAEESVLGTLENQYIVYDLQRSKEQWIKKNNEILKIIDDASYLFNDPQEVKKINLIAATLEDAQKTFIKLIELGPSQNLEKRVLNQLAIQTQKVNDNVLQLSRLLSENVVKLTLYNNRLFILFVMVLLLILIVNYIIFNEFVARPIESLTHVIEEISKGKFEYKISERNLKANDEVGDLSRAFERTLVSLKLAMKTKQSITNDISLQDSTK